MTSSFYKSWWREMGAISRGMMFIEGNIATPASLDRTVPAARPAPATNDRPQPVSTGLRKKADRLYRELLLLGGRPVTPGHNDDINEPFPQIDEDESAPSPRPWLPQRAQAMQSQTCATC
ncbi:MAG TPA: hypothetical protein VF471_13610 [Pseudoxanthomonas sp.]